MSHIAATDELFFNQAGLNLTRTQGLVDEALRGADDGELYLVLPVGGPELRRRPAEIGQFRYLPRLWPARRRRRCRRLCPCQRA